MELIALTYGTTSREFSAYRIEGFDDGMLPHFNVIDRRLLDGSFDVVPVSFQRLIHLDLGPTTDADDLKHVTHWLLSKKRYLEYQGETLQVSLHNPSGMDHTSLKNMPEFPIIILDLIETIARTDVPFSWTLRALETSEHDPVVDSTGAPIYVGG